ncbi:MAG: 2OG-Fe(II) oxygenase [Synechococcales cyanobacterium C42_A2020_086]|jgi:peroxiredoxin/predicted 2-oxoglutarate/Fe(II)-dependent dioxygenase YbiX|nr:2OG-Fe(II) oxygenase [Synechococcales cyanobacterium C42_A2020_086]
MVFFSVGDPVPWFTLPSTSSPAFHFDTVGGYYIVLFFFGSSKYYKAAIPLQGFCHQQAQFSALQIPFFGISIDSDDVALAEQVEQPTFFKFMWDFDGEVSTRYGVCQIIEDAVVYQPVTLVLDPNLRVLNIFPVTDPAEHVPQVMSFLDTLPDLGSHHLAERQAPVLLIPRVFEPEFCQHLVQLFEADGGEDSGFMREQDGRTVCITDYGFKKRRDLNLAEGDPAILQEINELVLQRVKPEIEKAFQFSITRFERHIVACYEGKDGGFFNRHRDNTTKGTAHRRFAMTINLNTGDYEGGYLWFPEYGKQLFRPEVGEAVIFSCSLLHEVTPVTSGRRFALLSFFYNDEDAKLRDRNRKYLAVSSNHSTASSKSSNQSRSTKAQGFQSKSESKSGKKR